MGRGQCRYVGVGGNSTRENGTDIQCPAQPRQRQTSLHHVHHKRASRRSRWRMQKGQEKVSVQSLLLAGEGNADARMVIIVHVHESTCAFEGQ